MAIDEKNIWSKKQAKIFEQEAKELDEEIRQFESEVTLLRQLLNYYLVVRYRSSR